MKNLFYFLSILIVIFITGCSKNNDLQLEKEQSFVLPDVNLAKIVENFDKDYATFSSYIEYAAFIKKFKEISLEEQQELISKVKYETIEEILDRAYEGMNDLETREEFVHYLKQYEKYLKLVELPNGEEESTGKRNY